MLFNAGLPFTRGYLLFRQSGYIVILPCLFHSVIEISRTRFQTLLEQSVGDCVVCLDTGFCPCNVD